MLHVSSPNFSDIAHSLPSVVGVERECDVVRLTYLFEAGNGFHTLRVRVPLNRHPSVEELLTHQKEPKERSD